jgi:uncharacterized protein with PIN domain
MPRRTMIDIADLLDVSREDEAGSPDDEFTRCTNCGKPYRTGGWHRCPDGTEVNA